MLYPFFVFLFLNNGPTIRDQSASLTIKKAGLKRKKQSVEEALELSDGQEITPCLHINAHTQIYYLATGENYIFCGWWHFFVVESGLTHIV